MDEQTAVLNLEQKNRAADKRLRKTRQNYLRRLEPFQINRY